MQSWSREGEGEELLEESEGIGILGS